MGKIIETIKNRFDGGMTDDLRSNIANKYALTKHFDAFSFPHKLVPYFETEAHESDSDGPRKDYRITDFLYDYDLGKLHGLGQNPSTPGSGTGIYDVDIEQDADGPWHSHINFILNDYISGCFAYYKDYIYFFAYTGRLCRVKTDSDTIANPYQSIDFESVAQAVHHSADDCLYLFADNKIYRQNKDIWDGLILELPVNQKIIKACEYGNYLAIATVSKLSINCKSTVYIWDRDSSLTTVSERMDLGIGKVVHMATLLGKLTVVQDMFIDGALSRYSGKLLIKQYNGNSFITVNELVTDNQATNISLTDFVKNDKLYFPYSIPLNGDPRRGIWCVDSTGKINLDFIEYEVESAASKTYQGIISLNNQWWIAHSGDGSINRTSNSYEYSSTNPSVFEDIIINEGDSDATKKVIGVAAMFEPLKAGEVVKLYYRKDEDIKKDVPTWTLIYTYSTEGGLSHGAINIESSGETLPTFKEIQYRVESYGGAVITGVPKYKHEFIDEQLF